MCILVRMARRGFTRSIQARALLQMGVGGVRGVPQGVDDPQIKIGQGLEGGVGEDRPRHWNRPRNQSDSRPI